MGLVINSIFFVLCALVGYLLQNVGLFSKIIVKRDKIPKMTIAGVRFKGLPFNLFIFQKKKK